MQTVVPFAPFEILPGGMFTAESESFVLFRGRRLVVDGCDAEPGAVWLRQTTIGPNVCAANMQPIAVEAFASCAACAKDAGHEEGGAFPLQPAPPTVPIRLLWENRSETRTAKIGGLRLLGVYASGPFT